MDTHRFRLDDVEAAYELFSHQRDGVLEVAHALSGDGLGAHAAAPGAGRSIMRFFRSNAS
jgi:hypothetical protein